MTLLFAALAVATPTQIAGLDGAHIQRPCWSPDGRQLSYEANYHDRKTIETWVGSPSGNFSQVKLTSTGSSPLTAGFAKPTTTAVVHELSWAPSAIGRHVFSASGDARDYELYISPASLLAPSPAADGGPAWSPDGRYIVFTSARTGGGDLYLVDVSAVELPPRQLSSDPTSAELFATWSSMSDAIAYVGHSDTGDNLWWLPRLDAPPAQLTDWSGNQIRPSFSPSGRELAFYANRSETDRFDLFVLDVGPASAEPRLLLEGVYVDSQGPSWTPDGAALVVVSDDNDAYDPIVRVAADGSGHEALALGTVGNTDLDLTEIDGKVWLAWTAQGRADDPVRDFRRLFVHEI